MLNLSSAVFHHNACAQMVFATPVQICSASCVIEGMLSFEDALAAYEIGELFSRLVKHPWTGKAVFRFPLSHEQDCAFEVL